MYAGKQMRYRSDRRRGAALVYVLATMIVMMGFCSLAVDLGRYELAHAQMANAALAAARAGAASIPYGASATTYSANAAAIANTVDGQPIQSSTVTIQYLNWVSKGNYTVVSAGNFSSCNAVRVTITYTVPLAFAKVLGLSSKAAVEYSTALLTLTSSSPYVYATGNVWLAGEPNGTTASQPDPNYSATNPNSDHLYPHDIAGTPGGKTGSGATYSGAEQYSSPVPVGMTVTPGSMILITSCSGSSSYDWDTSPYIDATGNTGTTWICDNAKAAGVSEHGIADATMPIGSLNAVFLDANLPDNSAAPPPLDFSTQTSRDYAGLQPKLKQPFYCGTGQTSGGVQQQIMVPQNATRMYFGAMDSWEWDNNRGGFQITVTQALITTVE